MNQLEPLKGNKPVPNDAPIDIGSPQSKNHSPWQEFYQNLRNYQQYGNFLPAVAHLAATSLQAEIVVVILLEASTQKITIPAIWAHDSDILRRLKTVQWPDENPASNSVFQTKGPSIVNDTKNANNGLTPIASLILDGIQNRATVPLRSAAVNGLLCAINKTRGSFTAHDIDLLCAIAAITSLGIEALGMHHQQYPSGQNVASFNLAKDRVIHRLSHALKTPLAVLIASVKLLEKHLIQLPDSSWRRITQRAQRNLNRLLTLEYELEDILRQSDEPISSSQYETVQTASNDASAPPFNLTSDRHS